MYSLSLPLCGLPLLCLLNIQQLEFHRITILTRVVVFVFVFCKRYSFLLFVVGWSFLFFVAPSLAVFYHASAFNQDVSKWNTGAVTTMAYSKCSLLSLSVATPSVVVYFEYTTTRVSSVSQFSHVLFFLFPCC